MKCEILPNLPIFLIILGETKIFTPLRALLSNRNLRQNPHKQICSPRCDCNLRSLVLLVILGITPQPKYRGCSWSVVL